VAALPGYYNGKEARVSRSVALRHVPSPRNRDAAEKKIRLHVFWFELSRKRRERPAIDRGRGFEGLVVDFLDVEQGVIRGA